MAEEQQTPPENTADPASIKTTPAFQETETATTEARVVDGITIPDWVDPAYLDGYVNSAKAGNPRPPNSRELTEILAGMPVEEMYESMPPEEWQKITGKVASMLYGVVGSNTDTRDWNAIMEAAKVSTGDVDVDTFDFKYDPEKLTAAIGIATGQMYGGTTVQFKLEKNAAGNDIPMAYITKGNGEILTSLSGADDDFNKLVSFGVKGTDWVTPLKARFGSMSTPMTSNWSNFFNKIETSYSPFKDYVNLFDTKFTTGLSLPKVTAKDTTADTTQDTAAKDTGVVEQTIKTLPDETKDVTPGETVISVVPDTTKTVQQAKTTADTLKDITTADTTKVGQTYIPSTTANLSALPATTTYMPNVTGTTMANLTTQSQAGAPKQVLYRNPQTNQTLMVTVNPDGSPLTYKPEGFTEIVQSFSRGGNTTQENNNEENKPEVKLARELFNFKGPADQLENFLRSNPAMARRMGMYKQVMAKMSPMRLGAQAGTDPTSLEQFQKMQQNLVAQTMQPMQAPISTIAPQAADFIGTTAGQAAPIAPMKEAATVPTIAQTALPTTTSVAQMTPVAVAPQIKETVAAITPATGTLAPQAQVTAQQQAGTSVSALQGQQGTAIEITPPNARELQRNPVTGDLNLISGAANAQTASDFAEKIDYATTTPSKQATVQGQLEQLLSQFDGGKTPAWAAGSIRNATAVMAERGLGASSIAGQAIIQATMEAALPIAQMDAQTQAKFEAQNLSNRQQRAMLAAQQRATFIGQEFDQAFQSRVQNASRISDIANLNFTAEQQISLENSRAANTMEINNLSNDQAIVMAEAAALSNMDASNLSNRQQSAVQNAQNFLQIDMTNLSNEHQAEMFKAQQNVQSLFTDQAAENAAKQLNATSQNQTNQFFANLSTQVGQFNSSQENAMNQYNVNAVNALRQFNSEIQQQRDLFNAQNGLAIAQANAQWRQNLATINTAATNESNRDFAKTMNALTAKNLDEIWQRERDIMSYSFASDQSAIDRGLQLIMADKELDLARRKLNDVEKTENTELAMRFLFGTSPGGILKKMFVGGGLFSGD